MSARESPIAPRTRTAWHGRFLEDVKPGDTFRRRLGRTVTEADNVWFTCLTNEHEPDALQHRVRQAHALRRAAGKQLPDLVARDGPLLPDTSENGSANLGWSDVKLPAPGVNQRGEVVIEFERTFMAYGRDSAPARVGFREPDVPWTVGRDGMED